MGVELSLKEKERRENILKREFADTGMEKELELKVRASLNDMPIAPLIEPFGQELSSKDKDNLYDVIVESPFINKQNEIVRAWFQIRFQDMIERGHISSPLEIICMNNVFGKEFGAVLVESSKKIIDSAELDFETKEFIINPKNQIEEVVFKVLRSQSI